MVAGRLCPLSYRTGAALLRDSAVVRCNTAYIVGGLYGNLEALAVLERRAEAEGAALIFNGDFNFLNAEPSWWRDVNEAVARHTATAGNVEVEAV